MTPINIGKLHPRNRSLILSLSTAFYAGLMLIGNLDQALCFQTTGSDLSPKGVFDSTLDQACVTCHSNAQPLANSSNIGLQQASIYLGQESHIAPEQRQSDIHARAVSKVWQGDSLTEAFQKIIERLGIEEKSAAFETQCLTCHAGIQAPDNSPQKTGRPFNEFQIDRKTVAKDSIGCEACHGRGQQYLLEHLSPRWLELTSQQKQERGFRDLENSAVAAQVCLSCHLGNPEESKVITHAMYAAGHPPLPPFDLPKFMQETCKKHWLDLDEKSTKWTDETQGDAKLRLEYLKKHFKSSTSESTATIPTLNAQIQSHFRKTQQSIVGQLTANLMSHDLMLHNTTPGQTWGDYAVYECVGCHQTLYKNIRGALGQPDRVPGRPLGFLWTRPVVASLKSNDLATLGSLQTRLDQELNATPFGSLPAIQSALTEFSSQRDSIKKQISDLAIEPLSLENADRWITQYLQERKVLMGNEWVAKQAFWTLETYFQDLEHFAKSNPPPTPNNLDLLERFKSLATTAPPVSHIVSCKPLSTNSAQTTDYTEFYKQLQAFIDAFLESNSQPAQAFGIGSAQ